MRWRVRLQVRYRRRADLALAALALAAYLAGLIGTLVWRPGQAVASPYAGREPDPAPILPDQDGYLGDQALTACALGYHMASLWEIAGHLEPALQQDPGLTRRTAGTVRPRTGWLDPHRRRQRFPRLARHRQLPGLDQQALG